MTEKELKDLKTAKEQIQEDIMCICESWGLEEHLNPKDWNTFIDSLCDSVITNINRVENSEK